MTNVGLSWVNLSVDFVLLLTFHLRMSRKWNVLINYSPEGLREVYITGGLAPMVSQPEEVYIRLFRTFQVNY